MTQSREFPTTSMAQRAANTPGPKTITALLEKVDFPNNYIHQPAEAGEEEGYFSVHFSEEFSDNYPNMLNSSKFDFDTPGGKGEYGASAWRKSDAVPVDQNHPPILTFKKFGKSEKLSDLYESVGDFFLISEKLRLLIEELDPGSLDCVKALSHDRELDEPFWACLPKRNLEAVDTTRSFVRIRHNNYPDEDGTPHFTQLVQLKEGVMFDPEVTSGVHNFWDIDLRKWFWSRELIATAHHAGIRGVCYSRAGKPIGGDIGLDELAEIYAEFAV